MSRTSSPSIVYIGAHDRSGSTLLDRILGELPGCVSVGELRRIWDRGLGENQLCGCGTPFRDCDFWDAVLCSAFGDPPDATIAEMRRLAAEIVRLRRFPGLLATRGEERSEPLLAYQAGLARLYHAVGEVSGRGVVIDSSKDAVYGAVLATAPELDVTLVHLVRDARAVAFSQQRQKPKPEIHWKRQMRRQRSVIRTALSWDLSGSMWWLLTRRREATLIRYEDLARAPVEELARLVPALGPEAADGLEDLRRGVHLGVAHTVSGASVRFHRGDLEVVPDSEWVAAMTPRKKRAVTALTWFGLRRYGYPLRSQEMPAHG